MLSGTVLTLEDEVRVQVPVADVDNSRDAGAVPPLDLINGFEHLRKFPPRNGDVFDHRCAEGDQRRMHRAAERQQTLSLDRIGRQFGVAAESGDCCHGRSGFTFCGSAAGRYKQVGQAS